MKKKSAITAAQFKRAARRLFILDLIEASKIRDSRTADVVKVVGVLKNSKDKSLHALGQSLWKCSPGLILQIVDSIGPKQRGGQRGPHFNDLELLGEMLGRVRAGETREAVAVELASKAAGGGMLQSKAQRLKIQFRRILGD